MVLLPLPLGALKMMSLAFGVLLEFIVYDVKGGRVVWCRAPGPLSYGVEDARVRLVVVGAGVFIAR